MENKQIVYDYDLHVNGIYGRKRKIQRDLFNLVSRSPTKVPLAEVEAALAKKLAEIKLVGSYRVFEREGELDDHFYTTKLVFGARPILQGERQ